MAGDLVAECVHDCVQEVVKESTDLPLSLSLYPVFDGTAYATIPQWDNVSADYTIEADTDNDDGYIVPATAPVTEIGRVGANYHSGNIKSVSLVDHSPLQGGSFVTGNASGTRAAHLVIPQLPAGSTFDFHYLAKTAAADQVLLGASEASALLTHTDAGTLTFGGDVTVEVDGVAVTSGSHSFNADQHYSIAVTLVNPLTITHIGTDSSDTNGIQLGVIGGVEAFNADTGDLYTLTGKNDSGNLLENSSKADRLGPELVSSITGTVTPSAITIANSGSTITLKANATKPIARITGLDSAGLYRVYFNKSGGGAAFRYKGSTYVGGISNGAVVTGITRLDFEGTTSGADTVFSGVSIRRIHALGTAEQLDGTETPAEAQAKGHGIWHESGTAMTDAEADVARTDLPRIDQRWKFNKPGQIYEQYSGEQAVLTNLDATDWQKP